jgi:recombination protein RecA
MKRKIKRKIEKVESYTGNDEIMISTGSTLLDLAISGKRKKGGGLPGGILVEIFGPESSGKTVLLCEIAGAIQRKSGDVLFHDPEARLNKQFAKLFDFNTDSIEINEPDTVTEMIESIRNWKPKEGTINGIFADSLAALSTRLELDDENGDKMGMRRAKEFSEGLRKVCRILKQNNYLMVCSNQIRDNADAMAFGEKFSVPGGKAMAFYSSVRLRFFKPEKEYKKKSIAGKEVKKVIGTKVKVDVYKNSVDAPYRSAELYIMFDYGIDDIRANLQYLKNFSKEKVYHVGEKTLNISLEKSINMVEEQGLEKTLKREVIKLWEQIDKEFEQNRKKKTRT